MAKPRPSRITKSIPSSCSTSRTTRHGSRFASASTSRSTGALQQMVDEFTDSMEAVNSGGNLACDRMDDGNETDSYSMNKSTEASALDVDMEMPVQEPREPTFQPRDKGKGKARLVETETEAEHEQKPFPIMDLPAEIRLEIYRACLTRPRKITLSKVERPSLPQLQFEDRSVGRTRYVEPAGEREAREEGEVDRRVRARRGVDAGVLNTGTRSGAAATAASDGAQPARQTASANRLRSWASRSQRPSRLGVHARSSSASVSSASVPSWSLHTTTAASHNPNTPLTISTPTTRPSPPRPHYPAPKPASEEEEDPLIPALLLTSKTIYKEARDVLYSENVFTLDLATAVPSLAALHQRSRRHIKHVELEIPTYTEILERFSEVVRLSLRYCTGLKRLVVRTPFLLPGADAGAGAASNTTVYANGFDILRWLPQQCEVVLEGVRNAEIEAVVGKHLRLAGRLDKDKYITRMIMDDVQLDPEGSGRWIRMRPLVDGGGGLDG